MCSCALLLLCTLLLPVCLLSFHPKSPPRPPPAPGLWRGDNGHVWTKGWGERFNSFWCCYGTAIESFSKLADSIYFHSPPPAHASEESSHKKPSFWARLAVKWAEVASHSHTSGPSSSAVPELYVNQLVSSTLRWHQLGLTLTQRAELYSTTDNVARVTLGVAFNPPPSRVQQLQWAHSSGGGKGRNASFVLQWRVPSWTDVQRMQVTLNGREIDVAALQAAGAAGGGGPDVATGRPGFNPPKFGQGAAFVPLASEFPDGSVGECLVARGRHLHCLYMVCPDIVFIWYALNGKGQALRHCWSMTHHFLSLTSSLVLHPLQA